jgi:hypothetical protein
VITMMRAIVAQNGILYVALEQFRTPRSHAATKRERFWRTCAIRRFSAQTVKLQHPLGRCLAKTSSQPLCCFVTAKASDDPTRTGQVFVVVSAVGCCDSLKNKHPTNALVADQRSLEPRDGAGSLTCDLVRALLRVLRRSTAVLCVFEAK